MAHIAKYKAEFGEQNLVHFTVHMDETTPHAHFGFTPIKDGTLSWKNYFDGRDALRGFQNRYWERVGKQWGLERGETGSGRTHKTTQEMKREAQREIKELDKRKECLRQEVEEMEAATPSLSEGVRTLWKARSDGSREEVLGSAIEGLRGRIIVEGKLPKAAPETVTLSLKVPAAMKRALEKEAKAEGKSTGAYARGILADGLMAIA